MHVLTFVGFWVKHEGVDKGRVYFTWFYSAVMFLFLGARSRGVEGRKNFWPVQNMFLYMALDCPKNTKKNFWGPFDHLQRLPAHHHEVSRTWLAGGL